MAGGQFGGKKRKVPDNYKEDKDLFYIGLATIMVSVVYVFNHYGANTARMPLRFSHFDNIHLRVVPTCKRRHQYSFPWLC